MHARRLFNRPEGVVLAAVVFGIVIAVVKGSEAGMRDSIGNISAPWLLLPYFAGATSKGPIRGALIGAATTFAALMGFYVAEAFVLDLGGHPLMTDLGLTLGAGRLYFVAGLMSGPLFGALGGVRTRHRRALMAAVCGLTLVGEPFVVFAWLGSEGMASTATGLVVAYPVLWLSELALGLLLPAGILAAARLRFALEGTD